jgi:hypothetical protein
MAQRAPPCNKKVARLSSRRSPRFRRCWCVLPVNYRPLDRSLRHLKPQFPVRTSHADHAGDSRSTLFLESDYLGKSFVFPTDWSFTRVVTFRFSTLASDSGEKRSRSLRGRVRSPFRYEVADATSLLSRGSAARLSAIPRYARNRATPRTCICAHPSGPSRRRRTPPRVR